MWERLTATSSPLSLQLCLSKDARGNTRHCSPNHHVPERNVKGLTGERNKLDRDAHQGAERRGQYTRGSVVLHLPRLIIIGIILINI